MRGYCGVGIYRTKNEINVGTLWRSAHSFGADFIFTVGRRYKQQASDTTKAWRHVPLFHFADYDDLLAHLPHDCRIVGVELSPRAAPVTGYTHPLRACYLLGAEDTGLPPPVLQRVHDLIEIPGLLHCLNVATAGSIVLYDRARKFNRLERLEAA